MLCGQNLEPIKRSKKRFKKSYIRPLPFDTLWAPFDLSDQQVDWPVDVVGLDVANNCVEEVTDLLVVCRSQRPFLLH